MIRPLIVALSCALSLAVGVAGTYLAQSIALHITPPTVTAACPEPQAVSVPPEVGATVEISPPRGRLHELPGATSLSPR